MVSLNKNPKKKADIKKKAVDIDNLLKNLLLQPLNSYILKDGNSMIGTFNIRAFGHKKLEDNVIMRIIIFILRRYDIILCQEVHFNRERIEKLVNMVSNPSVPYSYTLSCPVGKSLSEERFLSEKLHVKITLIGYHTQPGHAYNEIKALVTDVYAYVKKKSVKRSSLSCLLSLLCLNTKEAPIFEENCKHIILMGDFNTSGFYLNKTKQAELDIILAQNNLIWELVIQVILLLPLNTQSMIDSYL
ncbi:3240_t:CDS:2, partial [Racocetra persica]